ncbi:NAD(P)-binding protein, partial [Zopfia rhizophila CBS 207.26]
SVTEAGALICIAQRDMRNTSTADRIRAKGAKAEIVQCDLRDMEDAKGVFQKALDNMDGRIDITVNCGGLLMRKGSVDISQEEWDSVVDISLKALFFICQAAGRHMIPLRQGKIVNIASLNSFIGGEMVASNCASKGGVSRLTEALSNEWAKYKILVNAIAPGSVATDINTDLRADTKQYAARLASCLAAGWGAPADVAGPAVFLCSAASQYVTGEVLVVDGGHLGR